jgi:DNA-directed RNA polymerase specialized sigma24 family protein
VSWKGKGAERTDPVSLLSDPAHFDEFYRKYFLPLVRRASWKYRLEKEDARDVVQEAFVVALAKLDPSRNPKAWLIQVVDHLSVNFQRKVVRRAKLVTKWCPVDAGLSVGDRSSESDPYDDAVDVDRSDY